MHMNDDDRSSLQRGFADAALGLPLCDENKEYRAGYAIAEAVKETKHLFGPPIRRRSVDDILTGDAKTWASLTTEELRVEHEQLRRALETSRAQIALWSPIVAWKHRCPKCQANRLACPHCGDPW